MGLTCAPVPPPRSIPFPCRDLGLRFGSGNGCKYGLLVWLLIPTDDFLRKLDILMFDLI
jgi:hypothetical protein